MTADDGKASSNPIRDAAVVIRGEMRPNPELVQKVVADAKQLVTQIRGREAAAKTITHVACIDTDMRIWSLPAPFRHHHVLKVMHDHGARNTDRNVHQGFLAGDGRYLTRHQALVLATQNNLLKDGKTIASILTSEDLW